MRIENLKMPPFNTSLMGVLKGVLDYYDLKISNGMAYGGSGHAFLINIHDVVCPSGPYCWKYESFFKLVKNLGVETVDLGFFDKNSTADARSKLEQTLREHLDAGSPGLAQNMENQIIIGYDDKQCLLAMPWGPECEVTPPTLKFGTWDEFGDEIHASFLVFRKVPRKDDGVIIKESLNYAIDLFRHPEQYNFEKYRIGAGAYDNWIKAVEQKKANAHGNWWNATVWSECRRMASEYFAEIADKHKDETSNLAKELSTQYKDIADLLIQISDKEMIVEKRIPLLEQAKAKDGEAVRQIEEFIRLLN
jgi:hypothetical protein